MKGALAFVMIVALLLAFCLSTLHMQKAFAQTTLESPTQLIFVEHKVTEDGPLEIKSEPLSPVDNETSYVSRVSVTCTQKYIVSTTVKR